MKKFMKNTFKAHFAQVFGIIALAAVIGFSMTACPDDGDDPPPPGNEPVESGPIADETVVFTMKSEESEGDWQHNPDWSRWYYDYHDENNLSDFSSMLANDKVYVFTYSFSSNINIDLLGLYSYSYENDWKMITDWTEVNSNITKGTKYSGRIALIPNSDANGCDPEFINLSFQIKNRNVARPVTLYFYEFSFEEVPKESGLETWTVSGKEFTILPSSAFAETVASYQGKTDVLHIRPAYNASEYLDFVIKYDLNDYAGQRIKIEMSMDVWLNKDARIAWQINSSSNPYYPVVCGVVKHDPAHPDPQHDGPAQIANQWHSLTENYIYTVPNTSGDDDNGKQLYLSGMQIEGAEAYFANTTITITVQ